jgi:hypothetical protein
MPFIRAFPEDMLYISENSLFLWTLWRFLLHVLQLLLQLLLLLSLTFRNLSAIHTGIGYLDYLRALSLCLESKNQWLYSDWRLCLKLETS